MPKKTWNKPHSKITNHVFVFDLETSSKFKEKAEILECYGHVVDITTLTPKEDGEFGPVLVKPFNNEWDNVEDDALKKNGLNIDEIKEKGLDQEVFFNQLTAFLRKFQKSDKKWDALIPAGFNVNNYDCPILEKLAMRYNYVDADKQSKLFHPFHSFDLFDIARPWFFSTNTLESFSLENINNYFGLSNKDAHTAKADVINCSKILCRYLKFYKELAPKYLPKFKDCFKENLNVASN